MFIRPQQVNIPQKPQQQPQLRLCFCNQQAQAIHDEFGQLMFQCMQNKCSYIRYEAFSPLKLNQQLMNLETVNPNIYVQKQLNCHQNNIQQQNQNDNPVEQVYFNHEQLGQKNDIVEKDNKAKNYSKNQSAIASEMQQEVFGDYIHPVSEFSTEELSSQSLEIMSETTNLQFNNTQLAQVEPNNNTFNNKNNNINNNNYNAFSENQYNNTSQNYQMNNTNTGEERQQLNLEKMASTESSQEKERQIEAFLQKFEKECQELEEKEGQRRAELFGEKPSPSPLSLDLIMELEEKSRQIRKSIQENQSDSYNRENAYPQLKLISEQLEKIKQQEQEYIQQQIQQANDIQVNRLEQLQNRLDGLQEFNNTQKKIGLQTLQDLQYGVNQSTILESNLRNDLSDKSNINSQNINNKQIIFNNVNRQNNLNQNQIFNHFADNNNYSNSNNRSVNQTQSLKVFKNVYNNDLFSPNDKNQQQQSKSQHNSPFMQSQFQYNLNQKQQQMVDNPSNLNNSNQKLTLNNLKQELGQLRNIQQYSSLNQQQQIQQSINTNIKQSQSQFDQYQIQNLQQLQGEKGPGMQQTFLFQDSRNQNF